MRVAARSVYLLQHIARGSSDDRDVKVLGIFSSRREGELAIARFKKLAGFKRYPDGFYLNRFRINRLEWTEGFIRAKRPKPKATPKRKKPA